MISHRQCRTADFHRKESPTDRDGPDNGGRRREREKNKRAHTAGIGRMRTYPPAKTTRLKSSPMQKSTLIVYVRHRVGASVGTHNAETMSTRYTQCVQR